MRDGIRVLLIDPFVEEAEMYRTFLQCGGFSVTVCADSALACQTAEEQRPDVVVTRLRQQSSLTGIQVAQRLKSTPATQAVPVVIISTSILTTDREAAAAAGCDAYVPLPCPPDKLAAELRRLLGIRV